MKDFLKKLFCKHDYEKISWYEEYDKNCNTRYSIRMYRCTKCGKQIQIDGRRDPFDNTVRHFM